MISIFVPLNADDFLHVPFFFDFLIRGHNSAIGEDSEFSFGPLCAKEFREEQMEYKKQEYEMQAVLLARLFFPWRTKLLLTCCK